MNFKASAYCFSHFLLLFGCLEAASSSVEDDITYLCNTPHDELVQGIRVMSEDRKHLILEALKKDGGRTVNLPSFVLCYLGDPAARQEAIARFRELRFNWPELKNMGEPWVIEEFAPEMYKDEPYEIKFEHSAANRPLSYASAVLILENIKRSTIYSAAVVQWAQELSTWSEPEIRNQVRVWWDENKRFFQEKNYKAVQPGRSTASLPPVLAPVKPNPVQRVEAERQATASNMATE